MSMSGGNGGGMGAGGGRACFKCNEVGHMARDCPNTPDTSGAGRRSGTGSGARKEIYLQLRRDSLSQKLFDNEETKDLTIVVGNGAEVKCHKIIFSIHSPVLAAMISSTNGMLEGQTGRVEMRESSEVGLTHLLRYFYGFRVLSSELTCDIVVELMITAHKYELVELFDHLCRLLRQKKLEWYSPDDMLELYYHVEKIDGVTRFRDDILRIMKRIPEEKFRSCERYKGLTAKERETLVWKLVAVQGTPPGVTETASTRPHTAPRDFADGWDASANYTAPSFNASYEDDDDAW